MLLMHGFVVLRMSITGPSQNITSSSVVMCTVVMCTVATEFCDVNVTLSFALEAAFSRHSQVNCLFRTMIGTGKKNFLYFLQSFHVKNCYYNIGIKHDFPFINICKVPREVLKTEDETRAFQHLPRDLANVNEWQNHVWSLLLHKFKENTPKIEKMFAHFILQPNHHFLMRTRF